MQSTVKTCRVGLPRHPTGVSLRHDVSNLCITKWLTERRSECDLVHCSFFKCTVLAASRRQGWEPRA